MARTCRNKPAPDELNQKTLYVQDGWNDDGTRRMVKAPATRWEPSVPCGFLESADDSECDGCVWQRDKESKLGSQRVDCPQCDGAGTIHEGGMSMNPEIDNAITCPRCDGAGEIGGWE